MHTMIAEPTLAIWSLLGTVTGTLLLTAAALWASKQITQQARALWQALRGHTPDVIGAVDEPTDSINEQLARMSSVPAAVWAAFLPAFLGALAAGLDTVLLDGDEPGSGAV